MPPHLSPAQSVSNQRMLVIIFCFDTCTNLTTTQFIVLMSSIFCLFLYLFSSLLSHLFCLFFWVSLLEQLSQIIIVFRNFCGFRGRSVIFLSLRTRVFFPTLCPMGFSNRQSRPPSFSVIPSPLFLVRTPQPSPRGPRTTRPSPP